MRLPKRCNEVINEVFGRLLDRNMRESMSDYSGASFFDLFCYSMGFYGYRFIGELLRSLDFEGSNINE